MKNLALISLFVPTLYNCGGASALPYHLLKGRKGDISCHIYTYNINNIDERKIKEAEQALNAKITVLPVPWWFRHLPTKLLSALRIIKNRPLLSYFRLSKTVIKEIADGTDTVMIYGEEIAALTRHFPDKHCIVLPPDCEALYYARVLGMPTRLNSSGKVVRYTTAYAKYLNLARRNARLTKGANYFFVGEEDAQFYQKFCGGEENIRFLPHPHYEKGESQGGSFQNDKIRLIIPGRYDFYSQEAAADAIQAICQEPKLKNLLNITFLGKGWEQWAEMLQNAGFEVQQIAFAPVYADELARHDVALFPIDVGTGTKGKVLDAFVAGLLVIGTPRALENIQTQNCINYTAGDELPAILHSLTDREKWRRTAANGRRDILTAHSPRLAARRVFGGE